MLPDKNQLIYDFILLNIFQEWKVKTFDEKGLTCSTEERYSESPLDLETCKQTAEELGYNFIYFQPLSERPQGVWCHIYKSCEKTRIPSLGGRNYELSVPTGIFEMSVNQLSEANHTSKLYIIQAYLYNL